jgi:acyl dehydratase
MAEIDGYEVLGLGQYFEDLPVGRKFRTIGRTLTEADLVNFIGVTGMTEVLFSNVEFLKHESDIKQRVVPAAMIYAFAEGLLVHATMQHTGFAFLHMELDVKAPTFVGDTIHVECEVIESRRSASRPNRGLVRSLHHRIGWKGRFPLLQMRRQAFFYLGAGEPKEFQRQRRIEGGTGGT